MITYLKITGFKSFHNFEMEFTPLTVIAGANASGKSNLFDALMLLASLAETDNLKKAFSKQRGEFIELFTQYNGQDYATQIEFVVEMLVNKHIKDVWGNETELQYTRLRYELGIKRFTNSSEIEDLALVYERLSAIDPHQDKWRKLIPENRERKWMGKKKGKKAYIETTLLETGTEPVITAIGSKANKRKYSLKQAQKTILSSVDTIDFPEILAAKEEMKSWKFLQLNPDSLRRPTNKQHDTDIITGRGDNLAGALYRIKQEDSHYLVEISRKLNAFLPNFIEVRVVEDKENAQYIIKIKDVDKREFSSRVLSEGTLQLLTLCILEYDTKHTGLLCFEEPENGIHPFRIKDMAQLLKDLTIDFENIDMPLRQVIVNTHSPVLVGNLYTWKNDANVSIWFSQMRTLATDIEGKRIKMSISKTAPVSKENSLDMMLEFSQQEKKLTLSKVKEYLQTTHFDLINA